MHDSVNNMEDSEIYPFSGFEELGRRQGYYLVPSLHSMIHYVEGCTKKNYDEEITAEEDGGFQDSPEPYPTGQN
jgi:hypothetical protein